MTTTARTTAAILAAFPEIGTLRRGKDAATIYYAYLPMIGIITDERQYVEHADIEEVAAFISFNRLMQVGTAK